MHPLLHQRRALVAYVAFWAAAGGLPWLVIASPDPLAQGRALLVFGPMTALYGLALLPLWFVCRALTLGRASARLIAAVHGAIGGLASVAWTVGCGVTATLLAPWCPGLTAQLQARAGVAVALGLLFYALTLAFHQTLLGVQGVHEAAEREARLTLQVRDAQLERLRAQLHPHFLFNSLNTINALISADPPRARELCVRLGEVLRRSLRLGEAQRVPLAEEWRLAGDYLDVEALRFGAALRRDVALDPEAMRCWVPPLLLQPLVENAITHGIAQCEDGGTLAVSMRREAQAVHIQIENPRPSTARAAGSGGVGLRNLRRRLFAQYGERASLDVRVTDASFRVSLRLPRSEEEET
jgi:hypothetical protein